MAGPKPLRKRLTYRDLTGSDLLTHALHWRGFEWSAGSVMVLCYGPWGQVQVWASSEAEGRRVIAHAAAAGGWNMAAPDVEWSVAQATGGRNGRSGTMRTKETPLGIEVTKRNGPSGTAALA